MSKKTKPYDPETFKKLKKQIAEMLLIDISAASKRLQACDSKEVGKLAKFFELGYKLRGNHWRTTLQVCLPQTAISSTNPDGIIKIDPPKRASCRAFSNDNENRDPDIGRRLSEDTRKLLRFLSDSLSDEHTQAYQPLMSLFNENMDTEEPYAVQTQFGQRMLWLESIFEKSILENAKKYHRDHGLAISQATPPYVMREISHRKLIDFKADIDTVMGSSTDSTETLLPVVSARIVVNQRILELAHFDNSDLEARKMVIDFIAALNKAGFDELPDFVTTEGEGSSPADDMLLESYLRDKFGYHGSCLKGSEYFSRSMQDSDIDCAVKWSKILYEKYLIGRGSYAAGQTDPEIPIIHTGLLTRFLFTLVMAAAFYGRSRVSFEIPGRKHQDQSVFPSRGADQQKKPPTHVWLLLTQAYGLLYYGNRGFELRHESIDDYAEYIRFRRSCYQTLLHTSVAGRSASQVKALYDQISLDQSAVA